jgi:hypothetical protein
MAATPRAGEPGRPFAHRETRAIAPRLLVGSAVASAHPTVSPGRMSAAKSSASGNTQTGFLGLVIT